MWEDWEAIYTTSSTWKVYWVGRLGRIVHYLKYLETQLCQTNRKNYTLPKVPGVLKDWGELYTT